MNKANFTEDYVYYKITHDINISPDGFWEGSVSLHTPFTLLHCLLVFHIDTLILATAISDLEKRIMENETSTTRDKIWYLWYLESSYRFI